MAMRITERAGGKVLAVLILAAGAAGTSGAASPQSPQPPAASPARRALAAAPPADLEPQRVEAGRRSFRLYCASCHGPAARGDGPVARDLKIQPADLTGLARKSGGAFPYDRVYRAVDGREEVRGHGPGSMPVWGLSFQTREKDVDQEEQAREQIRDLLAYLQSIQAK
jgi:mono/diheme cytochrome c family protein